MLRVRVRQSGHQDTIYHFEKHEITVGKVHGLDIVLPSDEVSRHHALISWNGSVVNVTDKNSVAGTWRRIVGSQGGHFSHMTVGICGYELSFEIVDAQTKRPSSTKTPAVSAPHNIPSEPDATSVQQQDRISGPAHAQVSHGSLASETTGPSLRRRIDQQFRGIDEFDAFCLDYFPGVYKRFTPGMTRLAKQNLLLEATRREAIEQALEKHEQELVKHEQP